LPSSCQVRVKAVPAAMLEVATGLVNAKAASVKPTVDAARNKDAKNFMM